MKSILTATAVALVGSLAFAAPAAAQDDKRFSLTPYVWLPTVEGDLRFDAPPNVEGSPDVRVGPEDYLESLDGVLMLAGEARFGQVGLFTDFIYLDFSRDGSVRTVNGPGPIEIPIDVGTQVDLSGMLWTIAGGYDLVQNEHWRLQAFAGARYLGLEATVDWSLAGPLAQFPQTGTVGRDVDLWDGLVGFRGEARAGNWIFPYYVDVGAGSSQLTWQALVGVGYRFGWGDLRLDFRHLAYEQDDDDLIQELALSGPSLGATFRF